MKVLNKLLPVLGLSLCLGAPAVTAQEAQSEAPLPLESLRTFTEVFERIKAAYVEPVEDQTLLENAIKGMLGGLDPHSAYLDPHAFKDLQVNTSGEFGGLGIEVGMEDGFVRVVAPIDDTPAQRAGIQPGDMIIKLDDQAVQGMGLMDAVKLMRGKPGTDITLTIMREGETQPIEIVVTRAVIKVASVKGRLLNGDYGYLRISQFQSHTGADVRKTIADLAEQTDLQGLVLDLRNNPGGVLQAAVEVSDAFLDQDALIVYTEGRLKQAELRYSAAEEDLTGGLPLVVLINAGSASASEIVAGALQDHQRAIIMGTPSFGKGSVQTVLPLNNERALKLTTARYYTPEGRSIQAEGIVPDIRVDPSKVTRVEPAHQRVKEANLQGHLSNGNAKEAAVEEAAPAASEEEQEILQADYQLNEALNLLKGLVIFSQGRAGGG
ncbi:S41 family peptidase [Motiliproteus sp. SC1-56]|uniref:S41 family peptidase n=1 Tax=Motiliproteus sp. SC1-56 TaxID=2799565 RepID=UPI001A8EE83F|nr:S41 family peptidase [Motiliproteus sp. SC1-56]